MLDTLIIVAKYILIGIFIFLGALIFTKSIGKLLNNTKEKKNDDK